MLDITLLRKDLDSVIARLETRKTPQAFLDVTAFRALEAERKTIQTRTEELQARRNTLSKQIGQLKAKGPANQSEADAAMAEVGTLKSDLESSATRLTQIQDELQALLLAVPNLPTTMPPARLACGMASRKLIPEATKDASVAMTVSPAPVTSKTS